MINKTASGGIKKSDTSSLKPQYELFFRFSPIYKHNKSMKFMENNEYSFKKILSTCIKFTKSHIDSKEIHNTLAGKSDLAAKVEYRKMQGTGEDNLYKFKLNKKHSVEVIEEANASDGKLYVRLKRAGDLHKG